MSSVEGRRYDSSKPPASMKAVLRIAPQPLQKVHVSRCPRWWTKQCSRLRYWEKKFGSAGESSYEPMTASRPGVSLMVAFFFNDTATTEIYTLSLHDALPIFIDVARAVLATSVPAGRRVAIVG